MSMKWSSDELTELMRLQCARRVEQFTRVASKYGYVGETATGTDADDSDAGVPVRSPSSTNIAPIIDAFSAKLDAHFTETEAALVKERSKYTTSQDMNVFRGVLLSFFDTFHMTTNKLVDEMETVLKTAFFEGCPASVTEALTERKHDGTTAVYYDSDTPIHVPKREVAAFWVKHLIEAEVRKGDRQHDEYTVVPPSSEMATRMSTGARMALEEAIGALPRDHCIRRLYDTKAMMDQIAYYHRNRTLDMLNDSHRIEFMLDKNEVRRKTGTSL